MIHQATSSITDLRKENELLRQQIENLSSKNDSCHYSIFHKSSIPQIICEKSSNIPTTIIDCNKAFCDATQMKQEDIIGWDFMDILAKGEKKKLLTQAFDYKIKENINLRFDKLQHTSSITLNQVKQDQKNIILLSIKQQGDCPKMVPNSIEQALESSKQLFMNVRAGDILALEQVSLSAFRVTGYSAQQLQLNPFLFWNNCHPNDLKEIKKWLSNSKSFFEDRDVRFIHKSGEMVWLHCNMIKNTAKEGDPNICHIIIKEITNEKRLERIHNKQGIYLNTTLKIASILLKAESPEDFKGICQKIQERTDAERVSIYINDETPLSESYFSKNISLNDKMDQPSANIIWQNYKQQLSDKEIITYQQKNDRLLLSPPEDRIISYKNTSSAIITSILHQGKTIGYIYIASITKNIAWDKVDINFSRQVGELISESKLIS